MGYTTEFNGEISISPPLNQQEIAWIKKHNMTRRMLRKKGPYFVDSTVDFGQEHSEDVIDYNAAPEKQLSLWCGWTCNDDGTAIEWDGGEKFYRSAQWMEWLIENILADAPLAKTELPFLQGHKLSGEIFAQGEDSEDKWKLIVTDNSVYIANAIATYETAKPINS